MTSRERVLCALNHKAPDRVPLFIGTSGATTLLGPAYQRLVRHLGLPARPARWLSRPLQYALMDEPVLLRIRDLAPGGGYTAASVHCIQPDVPPENVLAMCEEVCLAHGVH